MNRNFKSNYVFIEKIGQGSYGQVFRAIDRLSNEEVAIKKIRCRTQEEGIPTEILREICNLKTLNHKNIIFLKNVEVVSDYAFLIFPWCEQSLKQFIKNSNQFIHPNDIKLIMKNLLEGVEYLHSNDILHRDLKPDNIVMHQGDAIKIIDFGLSKAQTLSCRQCSLNVQTLNYRAPEVLCESQYYTAVDIWSLGCIFYELFTKQTLFNPESEIDLLRKILRIRGTPKEGKVAQTGQPELFYSKYFQEYAYFDPVPMTELLKNTHASQEAMDLMDKMLCVDPVQRVSAIDALKHPYFELNLN